MALLSWIRRRVLEESGIAVKVRLEWGARNTIKFRVKGKNVAAAVRFLNARGEWGRFEGNVDYRFRSKGGIVQEISLVAGFTIAMPTWPRYRVQPRQVKEDWDSMYRALSAHEDGHRDVFERGAAKMVAELETLSDGKRGEIEAIIRKRMEITQREQDRFDTQTDHGKSTGVTILVR